MIMKHLIFFLMCLWTYDMMAQDMVKTNQSYEGFVKPTVMKAPIVAPTLWGDCDYFHGCETYIVYKSSVDKNIYLLGFDESDQEIMRLKLDDVNLNTQMTVCYLTYNGWTIRLYNRLQ